MPAGADQKMLPISAFVIAFNEEANLLRCLESISFCNEIVVIDSHSKDRTVEIAKEFGARVVERDWPGYVAQKAFGLTQVSNTWVLNLDADEEVSEGLREEIFEVLKSESETPSGFSGYEVNRVVYYWGRWWRSGGWYPEFRLRLVQRDEVIWGGRDPHEKPIPKGKVGRLKGELFHYTYKNLSDQFSRLHSFSTVAARSAWEDGKRVGISAVLVKPCLRAFKFFILKRGYREGRVGLIVALVEGYYTFMKYAKLLELQWQAESDQEQEREKDRIANG